MSLQHVKYIIIGAGLSGLTTAHVLLDKNDDDFLVLEARNRIGGRIHTKEGIDLGATWFQDHHTHLSQLMTTLNLGKFKQFSKGKSVLVYNSMAPAHYFESDPSAPSAHRISNGSIHLIEQLAIDLKEKIKLEHTVTDIVKNDDLLTVKTAKGTYLAEKVIVALPPQLATHIAYTPALPEPLQNVMLNTHTWMSNAIKVGITYERPFWRDKGFSGTVIGQIGPTIELYDHSNVSDTSFSLMGFVNEGLRDELPEDRKERILSYLEKHLGKEARNYNRYYEKDWSTDPFTSSEKLKSVYISPRYGNPVYQESYMNGSLFFSGAETSPVHGGYMDGAIYTGLQTASKLHS